MCTKRVCVFFFLTSFTFTRFRRKKRSENVCARENESNNTQLNERLNCKVEKKSVDRCQTRRKKTVTNSERERMKKKTINNVLVFCMLHNGFLLFSQIR